MRHKAKGNAFRQHRKVWRWEFLTGMALIHGWRYGAELGVSTGRNLTFMLSHMPDLRLIGVDLWTEQPGNDDVPGGESYTGWEHGKHFEKLTEHCNKHFPNRVQLIRECSWEAARHVADGVLDFVFVDADHSYDAVVKDIAAWLPKVRAGGMIAGHDYDWPTTGKAVDDTLGNVLLADDSVWMAYIR